MPSAGVAPCLPSFAVPLYLQVVTKPEAYVPRRISSLNEFNMQSRLMTEEETKLGKRSNWYRLNLQGRSTPYSPPYLLHYDLFYGDASSCQLYLNIDRY